MDISLVPSLQHLTCSRLIVSLFNHLEVQKNLPHKEYCDDMHVSDAIKCQVKDAIPRLTSCTRLQEKLEVFIDPLFREIDYCLDYFSKIEYCYDSISSAVRDIIPRCWLSDGTIDREKLARLIIKNENLHPVNRFIFACTSCCFSEALDAWNVLLKIDKAYLKYKSSATVKLWIEWFESSSIKDWESFLAWSSGSPLLHSNVSTLKHVLQTISPADRGQYLLNALIGKEVDDDVMRLCMSVMTKDEQDQVFRQSTAQVFSLIISWPLRPIYFDIADDLRQYFTEQSFCNALQMILRKIETLKREDIELLIILESFWEESPEHFKNAAKDDPELFRLAGTIENIDVRRCLLKRGIPQNFWNVFLNKSGTSVGFAERQELAAWLRSSYIAFNGVNMPDYPRQNDLARLILDRENDSDHDLENE